MIQLDKTENTDTLKQSISYLEHKGFENIKAYERELLIYATKQLKTLDGVTIYGPNADIEGAKASVISFNFEGIHPYDVGSILDQMGIAVRTGQHCAQPIMDFFKIPGHDGFERAVLGSVGYLGRRR